MVAWGYCRAVPNQKQTNIDSRTVENRPSNKHRFENRTSYSGPTSREPIPTGRVSSPHYGDGVAVSLAVSVTFVCPCAQGCDSLLESDGDDGDGQGSRFGVWGVSPSGVWGRAPRPPRSGGLR